MRKLLLLIVTPVLIVGLIVAFVIINLDEKASIPPPASEKTVTLYDIVTPIPDEWLTKNEEGVAYAYEPPCTFEVCKHVAVYGQDALAKDDWHKLITDTYRCQSNSREMPGAITPRGTRMIGDRGAYYYTMKRCGVSNIETLGIWQTQIPPRLIVTQLDSSAGLPDLEKRLNRARWTA